MSLSCSLPARLSKYEPYFQSAERFYGLGDYAQAIGYYIKAITENDRRPETYYGLAMAYYQHGDLEEARLAFEKTLEIDPKNLNALERLASVNIDLGNPSLSVSLCKQVMQRGNGFVRAVNTLGHAYFALGKLDSAQQWYNHAVFMAKLQQVQYEGTPTYYEYDDDISESYNGLAQVDNKRGLFAHALEYLGWSIALTPNWDTPWYNKGKSYQGLGNSKAAEIAYRRAIDLAPSNVAVYKSLARLFRRIGGEDDAIAVYREALRIDASDVECYQGIADIYERRGDYTPAAEVYDKLLEYTPEDPAAYFQAARINMKKSDDDRAIDLLVEATRLNPDYAEAYNALGEAYRSKQLLTEAQGAFLKAIAADSLYPMPLRNMGYLLIEQGKESDGLQLLSPCSSLG